MNDYDKASENKDIRREVIERYCNVIDGNAVIMRTINHNCKTSSFCMSKDKCPLSEGCKNRNF